VLLLKYIVVANTNYQLSYVQVFLFVNWCEHLPVIHCYLMSLSTVFQLQLCHGGQFYWLKKVEYLEKTTTYKLYDIRLYYIGGVMVKSYSPQVQ
jgi:hypothetical protein